jgi:Flp pilus assembly protein TadD
MIEALLPRTDRIVTPLFGLVALLGAAVLSGCANTDQGFATGVEPVNAVSGAELAAPNTEPGDGALLGADPNDPLGKAKAHFRRAEYALAEAEYRAALQRDGRDYEAWIGLAASYDQLRRFDLADRAYSAAARVGGMTATLLNNQGYSNLLRGDYGAARRKFELALAAAPDHPQALQNLEILAAAVTKRKSVE